jgi:hypothetical protein
LGDVLVELVRCFKSNEVSVISSGVEMNIGEADNLNDIHFSTNLGLGSLNGFFKNFEARVEPVLNIR